MAGSLTDILTSAQNLVTAVNGLIQNFLTIQGVTNKANISAATLVKQGAGRVATVVVTTAGSAAGAIYDTNAATSTNNPIYTIPNTAGAVFVNMPVNMGIVVAPGTGQVVAISYS